jgi:hypothetical protein
VSLLAARGLGHYDEPHAPLSDLPLTSLSLNFRRAKKKADHGFTLFSLDELSAFCLLCGKRASGKLANQR